MNSASALILAPFSDSISVLIHSRGLVNICGPSGCLDVGLADLCLHTTIGVRPKSTPSAHTSLPVSLLSREPDPQQMP